jgi:hypothetical protein
VTGTRWSLRADPTAPLRQVLAHGTARDAVDDAPLAVADVTLAWQAGGAADARSGTLPVTFARRPGGWFALHLVPGAELADLVGAAAEAGVPDIVLTAHVTVIGREPVEITRAVPAADLAIQTRTVEVGSPLTVQRVVGAPVDVSAAVPPRAVGLRGVVLRAHDPAEPVGGATVAVDGGPTVTTDDGGRFVVDALPLAATIEVTVSDGTATTTVSVRPDYGRPVQLLTVSLPG